MQYNTAIQYSNTIQYTTIQIQQYNTIQIQQYNTVQHNTIQYKLPAKNTDTIVYTYVRGMKIQHEYVIN